MRLAILLVLIFTCGLLAQKDIRSALSADQAAARIEQLLASKPKIVKKYEKKEDARFLTLTDDGGEFRGESVASGAVHAVVYVYARCGEDDRAVRARQKRSLSTLQLTHPDLFTDPNTNWSLVEQVACKDSRDRRHFVHGFALMRGMGGLRPGLERVDEAVSNSDLRPWKNDHQKLEFMFKLAGEIAGNAPVSDACMERIEASIHGKTAPRSADFMEGDPCTDALRSCGNCHLPAKNNCNFTVTYWNGDRHNEANGTVVKEDLRTITLGGETQQRTIAREDVIQTRWENGADPVEVWWNFKSISSRGSIAKKMLALSAEKQTGCATCHIGHGDFRMTPAGEEFAKTGVLRSPGQK
jgi:hypothetical protein